VPQTSLAPEPALPHKVTVEVCRSSRRANSTTKSKFLLLATFYPQKNRLLMKSSRSQNINLWKSQNLRHRQLVRSTGLLRMNTTSRRSQDFKSLSVKLSQLHPLLMIRFHQKMTGLQHLAAVDEASVERREVGEVDTVQKEVGEVDTMEKEVGEVDTMEKEASEVDITEKEVGEDIVEGVPTETATAGVLTAAGEMGNSEDAEKVTVVVEMVSGEAETKVPEDEGMVKKVTVAAGGDEVNGVLDPLLSHSRSKITYGPSRALPTQIRRT